MVTVEIKGLKELHDSLKMFGKEMEYKVIASGTYRGALLLKNHAISRAPMHPWPHKVSGIEGKVAPGHLRRNIIIRKIKLSGYTRYIVTVRAKAFYAKFLEFGTSKMAAKPFMRPAFDLNAERAISVFRDTLAKEIDKLTRKFGKTGT